MLLLTDFPFRPLYIYIFVDNNDDDVSVTLFIGKVCNSTSFHSPPLLLPSLQAFLLFLLPYPTHSFSSSFPFLLSFLFQSPAVFIPWPWEMLGVDMGILSFFAVARACLGVLVVNSLILKIAHYFLVNWCRCRVLTNVAVLSQEDWTRPQITCIGNVDMISENASGQTYTKADRRPHVGMRPSISISAVWKLKDFLTTGRRQRLLISQKRNICQLLFRFMRLYLCCYVVKCYDAPTPADSVDVDYCHQTNPFCWTRC